MPESQLKTILLVEDDETSAIVVSKQVKHFGYNVISVNTGEKAVELATSDQNIDLIIMDIVLGEGIDGTTAAKQILAKRKVPIVFLSSHSEKKIVEKVRGISRYGYVLKNSEEFVLQSSIEMAFDLFETHRNVESGIDELKKSEERYRTLFETMAQGVVYQDADGKITSANAAAEHILGLTLDQMQGRSSIDPRWRAIHEDGSNFPGDLHPAMVALRTGKPVNNVVMGVYHPQTDQQVWININAVPEFRPDETSPFQVYATFDDITERKKSEGELRESETKYRLIAENTSDGIIIFDGENKIRYVSSAYNKQLGYTEMEELARIPDDIYSIIHVDDRDIVFPTIFEAIKLKKSGLIYAYRVKHKAGHYIWREDNATFKYDNAGNYTGAYVICRDISERKLAEVALCLSEERFRAIWEESFDGMRLLDKNGKIILVNDAFCKQIGKTRDELENKLLDVMYDPCEAEKILSTTIEKFRKKTVAPHFERQITLWNERKVWFELSNSYIKLGTGQNYLLSIFRDITERKQAEELLKESEFKYRALIENSNDSIFCVDKEGYYKFVNNVFASTFGKTPEYFYGKSFWDIYSKEQADMRFAASSKVFETGKAGSVDVEVPLPDRLLYFIAKTNPIRDPQGNVILNLTIATDITERKKVEEELRESEDKYRGVVEHSPNAIAVYVEGKIVFVNNQCVVLMAAANKEELIGKSVVQFVHPDNRAIVIARMQQVAIDGKPLPTAEEKFIRLDGTSVDVEVRAVPTTYIQKPAVQLIVQDITERKQSEEALKVLATTFADLSGKPFFEAISRHMAVSLGVDFVYVGEYNTTSNTISVLGGCAHGELMGDLIYPLADTPCKEVVGEKLCIYPKAVQSEFPKDLLLAQMGIEGYVGSPIFDKQNQPIGILVALHSSLLQNPHTIVRIFNTFSDRVAAEMQRDKAEKALILSNERLAFAQRSAGAGVWDWDMLTGKLNWSPELYRLFGLDPAKNEATLDLWNSLLHPDDIKGAGERINEAIRNHKPLVNEYRVIKPSGDVLWINALGDTVYNERGEALRMSGICIDITDRKNSEQALRQSQKLESIGTLASGIAHDFNNILNVIVGNSDLLNKSSLDEKNVRRINAIASSATRGMHLVKQLLMFARKTKENYIPLFINDVVEDIAKLISETFPKTITVSLEFEKNLPKISADPNHMHQVLMNLSVNARDAMPSGGTLRYCASLQSGEILRKRFPEASTDRYVVLTVKDTGLGMDEETLRKIFDPFYTTKEVGKGTGLGMSVVQGIIKSHNGFIDVRSKVNIGTEIEIYLPVLDSEETTVISEIFENTLNLSGNETILLIEDEEFTRDVIEDLLHFNGYQVIHARDGEEGVELYKNKKDQINIVVSDFGLPKFNGEEVFRRIKGINPEVRFILISGYLEPGISNRLTTLGVNTIVAKPFKPDGLLSKIRETLDNRK